MYSLGFDFNKKERLLFLSVIIPSTLRLMHLPLSFAHWLAILSMHIRTTSEFVIFPPNGVKGRAISLIKPIASKFSNFFFFLLKITQKLLLFLNSSKRKELDYIYASFTYSTLTRFVFGTTNLIVAID